MSLQPDSCVAAWRGRSEFLNLVLHTNWVGLPSGEMMVHPQTPGLDRRMLPVGLPLLNQSVLE